MNKLMDYEVDFLKRFDEGKTTEDDVKNIARQEFGDEIERVYGEPRRWSRWCTIYFQVGDRYFETGFDEGLTEMQEDEFYDAKIIEVRPVVTTKTITVTEYVVV
ncbi:MAG: hypothetical protein ACLRVU_01145 [Beduini sp.]|uniref:hypothetical protein n=1 Tax=Beduini sp. TaxID=1922300 RepID=UPI00399FC75C